MECLPAGHGVVSVEHLLSQLAVLDPARELNVSELITQELRPQEPLQTHTHTHTDVSLNAINMSSDG